MQNPKKDNTMMEEIKIAEPTAPEALPNLLSLLPEELEALLLSCGEPKYRAKQMFPELM